MNNKIGDISKIELVLLFIITITISLLELVSFLLFHVVIELITVIISCLIASLGYFSYRFKKNSLFNWITGSFLFIAIIDLFHILTYNGMGVLPIEGANVATQFWIAGRYYQAFMLLIGVNLGQKKIPLLVYFLLNILIVSVIFITIFLGIFPSCYVEEHGLTLFKISSEYIIIALLIITLLSIKLRPYSTGLGKKKSFLSFALILMITSEFTFTLYFNVYGIPTLLGHIIRLFSFYCFFKLFFRFSLDDPLTSIYQDLALKDELLERKVKELDQEITQRKEIESLLKEYLLIISRDMRDPITIIYQGIQNLQYENELPDEMKKEVYRSIERNIDQIIIFIDNLKLIYEVERKKMPLEYKELDIEELSNTILNALDVRIKSKNIICKIALSNEVQFFGDKTVLVQILTMLLILLVDELGRNDSLYIELSNSRPAMMNEKIPKDLEHLLNIFFEIKFKKKEQELKHLLNHLIQGPTEWRSHIRRLELSILKKLLKAYNGEIVVSEITGTSLIMNLLIYNNTGNSKE